jgi:hypothetical protein
MSFDRAVAPPTCSWRIKLQARNDTRFTPALSYTLEVPTSGVELTSGSLLADAFEGELEYLLSYYDVDDVLFHFRERGAPGGLGPASGSVSAR